MAELRPWFQTFHNTAPADCFEVSVVTLSGMSQMVTWIVGEGLENYIDNFEKEREESENINVGRFTGPVEAIQDERLKAFMKRRDAKKKKQDDDFCSIF